jgi:hypothetical protein
MDPHLFGNPDQDPDPDPDPHPDPQESDKLYLDPHPHRLADDEPKCMEYELI